MHSKIESPFQTAWRKGKQAARENRYTGLGLWLFGCAIFLGYYNVELVRELFESLGRLKIQSGWTFGILSTALFGGFLPIVMASLIGKKKPPNFWPLLISNVLFWGFKGFEIDLLYRFQDMMFGSQVDLQTIICKVCFDMLIYAPLIGLLNCVLFYVWRDNGYSFARTRRSLGKNWYVRKVLPALISNCCVWLPSVIFIYSLPLALQLPVQNLILCFWVLVLVFFTSDEETEVTD
ncbi:MAG: hypothetical protein AB8B55_13515 [Mariniblastus sp.]